MQPKEAGHLALGVEITRSSDRVRLDRGDRRAGDVSPFHLM